MKLFIVIVLASCALVKNMELGFKFPLKEAAQAIATKSRDAFVKKALSFCDTTIKLLLSSKSESPECSRSGLLHPIIEMLVNQTASGTVGYKYHKNITNLSRMFLSQFELHVLLARSDDESVLRSMTKKLPGFAATSFSGTQAEEQISLVYTYFCDNISLGPLINLLIGSDSSHIFVILQEGIRKAFAGHPDFESIRDMHTEIKKSFTKGSGRLWAKMLDIIHGLIPI